MSRAIGLNDTVQNIDQSFYFSAKMKKKKILIVSKSLDCVEHSGAYILTAKFSVDFKVFEISSAFAIIVYIVLILESMQSVNLFTAFLYVSTLSAAIDDI